MAQNDQDYYDRNYDDDYYGKQQRWLDAYFAGTGTGFSKRISSMLEYTPRLERGKLLDLGCGVGTFALLLAQQGFETVGLDISERAIERCQRNARRFEIGSARFVLGGANGDQFPPGTFDAIVAADIIEHLSDPILRGTLERCRNWLRPGGTMLIHTFPTVYYYMVLLNRGTHFLRPLSIAPTWGAPPYLWFLDRVVFEYLWLLPTGRRHSVEVAESAHCNPPHPHRFRRLLEETGFDIEEYTLLSTVLSDLETDRTRHAFCERLIERFELLRPGILALVRRPRS